MWFFHVCPESNMGTIGDKGDAGKYHISIKQALCTLNQFSLVFLEYICSFRSGFHSLSNHTTVNMWHFSAAVGHDNEKVLTILVCPIQCTVYLSIWKVFGQNHNVLIIYNHCLTIFQRRLMMQWKNVLSMRSTKYGRKIPPFFTIWSWPTLLNGHR